MDEASEVVVGRWLQKAQNDFVSAKTILFTQPTITDTVCFHAQQCAEKTLKAFLVHSGIHVEKTHNLPRLLALCRQADRSFEVLIGSAAALNDYSVEVRYVEDWRDIPHAEAVEAVQHAEQVMAFVRKKLAAH